MPKKILSSRPCLDVKEVKILSGSAVLENIYKGIITGFGIKAVEHEEWLSCSALMLIISLVPEQL